ncbi:hypothetical protein EDB19DRAFT_1914938 [Suillus lakei]|nr:hypothetical protein EDB19DRAFT_1914938 [Suillus lakei]
MSLSPPPSPLPHDYVGSPHGRRYAMPEEPNPSSKTETAERNRELQDLIRGSPCFAEPQALSLVCKLSPDVEQVEQDKFTNTKYTIDTVYASYTAAQHRFRQYAKLLELLKREENEWAQKVEKASYIMPEYKPLWLLPSQG